MRPYVLGAELGSTRIKAVVLDGDHIPVSAGEYQWQSLYENGLWTYPLEQVWQGLRATLRQVEGRERIAAMGISAMMHGYLAFDENWELLVPFRTWQNTTTGPAAQELTRRFGFPIPQRWSVAHLYQAILNGEEHVSRLAHITTLAGYVHYMLTGVNAVGIGDASGIFPVDSEGLCYHQGMLDSFDALVAERALPWRLRDLLPQVLPAGQPAGELTAEGARLLEGLLPAGIPFAPPEGDAGTGMAATNSVAPRTGNVSAGTSIFSMVVLERPLQQVHPEIDLVATPAGQGVAMVHCNNCTGDLNAWAGVFRETAVLLGAPEPGPELYPRLFRESLRGEADCGGILVCNYLAGEGVTGMDSGRPLVVRRPDSRLTLANLLRAQIYSALATLSLGMEILAQEGVAIDSLTGHGGLFKTPGVGQRFLAAACGVPVKCMRTAGEGGPYGMALLAAYRLRRAPGESLEEYLRRRVFAQVSDDTLAPDPADQAGFQTYLERYRALLTLERTALHTI